MQLPFFTIGHSTRSIPEFVELLRVGGVQAVVDIRTVPRSRTNPQYNEDALGPALAGYQIGHCRIASLGGLRGRAAEVPPEVNAWWDNRSFHNYADHALSEAFAAGMEELVALGRERRVAMMCSGGLVALPSPHRRGPSARARRGGFPPDGTDAGGARPPFGGGPF
jgi:uncharacterized protein (DUF488 family)